MTHEPSNEPISADPNSAKDASSASGRPAPPEERRSWNLLSVLGAIALLVILLGIVVMVFSAALLRAGWEAYDLGSGKPFEVSNPPVVIDSQDRVWTWNAKNDLVYLEPGGTPQILGEAKGEFVRDIAFDDQGQIWFLTQNSYGIKWAGGRVYVLAPGTSLADSYKPAVGQEGKLGPMAIDPQGRLWIGLSDLQTYDRVLVLQGENDWTEYKIPSGSCSGIDDIAFDDQGQAWIAACSALYRLDLNAHWKKIKVDFAPLSLMVERNQGKVWIGGESVEILDLDGKRIELFTSSNSDLIGSESEYRKGYASVRSLVSDYEGRVYIGSEEFGLTMIDPDGNWRTYTHENSGLAGNSVNGIGIDSQGKVWVVSTTEDYKLILNSFDPNEILPDEKLAAQILNIGVAVRLALFIIGILMALTGARILIGRVRESETASPVTKLGVEPIPLDLALAKNRRDFWMGVRLFFGLNLLLGAFHFGLLNISPATTCRLTWNASFL